MIGFGGCSFLEVNECIVKLVLTVLCRSDIRQCVCIKLVFGYLKNSLEGRDCIVMMLKTQQ